jgi:hypothetical protein
MPLVEKPFQPSSLDLPPTVAEFLGDAERRITDFQQARGAGRIPGFECANFQIAYRTLRELARLESSVGKTFCEWGSGFGVITCLARMLDFQACGIEIEQDLVAAARQLAADYALDVTYFEGSYKPPGTYDESLDEHSLHVELGFPPMEFDLIFVYPWPSEEKVVEMLIDRFAKPGTSLLTYHGGGRVRLRSKT